MKYRLFLIFLPIALFLGIEFFMRFLGVGSVQIHQELENGLIVRKPNTSYLHTKENRNTVYYNNLGFHDIARKQTNDPKHRILVIGDSFVEGAEVPMDLVFTRQAEILLEERSFDAEIINAGTSGSNTAYQYLLWKDYLAANIKIDRLVLCLYLGDDLAQNHPELLSRYLKRPIHDRHFFIKSSGEVKALYKTRSPLVLFFRSLTHHSRILHFAYSYLSKMKREMINKPQDSLPDKSKKEVSIPAPELKQFWDESIEGTMKLLHRWKKETSERGIQFGIMVIPSSNSLAKAGYGHPALDEFILTLQKWTKEKDIPFLEINFDKADPYQLYSFDGRRLGHFSKKGHTRTAEQMAFWLENIF